MPDCTLIVRPVFAEAVTGNLDSPSAEPEELAAAILACIEAGARVINLSLALMQSSPRAKAALLQALDHAARRGVLIVAAAGNQGAVAARSSPRILGSFRSARAILAALRSTNPILAIRSGGAACLRRANKSPALAAKAEPLTLGGTSAAAPFVTGAIALIWSLIPASERVRAALGLLKAHAPSAATSYAPVAERLGGLPSRARNASEEVTPC